jgi:zinc protease
MQLGIFARRCASAALAAFVPAFLVATTAAGQGSTASRAARSAAPSTSARTQLPATLPHTRFVLPNGLVAIIHENHASPIVSVQLFVHAGSKDDPPGRSGLAHLLEHVMGEGSSQVAPREFERIVQASGGLTNAETWEDKTRYFTTVPSNMLETVLWLEADRFASKLAGVKKERIDSARAPVNAERRLRIVTPLFGGANEAAPALLFASGHPYHYTPLGIVPHVDSTTLDELQAFARRYYVPNNAVLVVAGDIQPAAARALVARYFGPIPRGDAPVRTAVPSVKLSGEQRVVLEDSRAQQPQLRFLWVAPGTRDSDKAAVQMLAKTLGAGRASVLQRALVYDRPLAAQVIVGAPGVNGYFDLEESGIFQIDVTPRPNVSLTDIERAIDSAIAKVQATGVDAASLQRAVNDSSVAFVMGLGWMHGRGAVLGDGELFHRNPTALIGSRGTFAAITSDDVRRAATRYLTSARVVMSMVPATKLELRSKPDLPYVNITPGAGKK